MKTKITLAKLVIGVSVFGVGCACHRPPPPDGQADGSGMMREHHPMLPSPLMLALDVNHDGVIDSNEIANASEELKALDKNGDGRLTPDELRPVRPPQAGGSESDNDKPPGMPPGDK